MLRETGSTRVMEGGPGSGGPGDGTLRAVLAAVAGQYELLGEMGRGVAGTITYLARELDSSHLVILRLDPVQSGDGSVLSVMRELSASTPGGNAPCPECGATAVGWGRFCPTCGADLVDDDAVLAGTVAGDRSGAASHAAPEGYDLLGSVPRAGGPAAGAVHFARELATGGVVALAMYGGVAASNDASVSSFRVLQTLLPLTSGGVPPAGAWPGSFAPNPDPAQSAQLPRAQPTAHRANPQEVLIPADDLISADDRLPPRPPKRVPRWWIAAAALASAAIIGLAAFVKARVSQPDATEARLGSGGMGITLASPSPSGVVATAARVDSGFIRIAGQLPRAATVTIDGEPVTDESMSLLPGQYLLAASAPGYASVSEHLTLEPGQTLVWMPTLAALRDEAPSSEHSVKRVVPPSKSGAAKADAPVVAAAASTPTQSCQSAFDAKEWEVAASLCASEARQGTVSAQRNLGVMYDRGVGVERDPARASDWLRRAAEAGSRDAAYLLGAMYESGRGVTQDDARALAWYSKAALLGDREAQVKVGKAYEQGHGVASDIGEALTWYRKAAGQGDAWAQNYIGFLYGNGKGVPHDDAQALEWFRRAAANGNAQAEYNVGFMYANGRGVQHSDQEAVRWYKQAARHGYDEAVKELERRGIKP